MNEITMRIRYKRGGQEQKVSIQIEEDHASCEALAQKFAEKLTTKYAQYIGGKKNRKELSRYEFGQYKLILMELEAKT